MAAEEKSGHILTGRRHPNREASSFYLCSVNKIIKIGGVPEHFNLPWQFALESGLFESSGLQVEWTFYAGGTGAMTAALSRGDLDLAILLTEGYVSAKAQSLDASIVKTYIASPLVWGIYTGAENELTELNHQPGLRYAVSRFGSGSHLMAMVHARQRGIDIKAHQFSVVNSLHGGVDALVSNEADVFYWEKFMTRPFVKSGNLRKIGEFSAPWSGFLIVASHEALRKKEKQIKAMLDTMIPACIAFKEDPMTTHHLSRRFEMTESEAAKWLSNTRWNNDYNFDSESLENAKEALKGIGIETSGIRISDCLAQWLKAK